MDENELYAASLLDPFDNTISQPKIFDGTVSRSSGLRFRNTGNFTCNAVGDPTYVVMVPGFANLLAWNSTNDGVVDYDVPAAHPTHVSDADSRADTLKMRVVSGALQLSLLNSSDQNEGYWEAVRIPVDAANFQGIDVTQRIRPIATFALASMANHSTFQTGKLKEIHRFQFKLNSESPQHPFVPTIELPTTGSELYDHALDCVVIKIIGRVDATIPSLIMYNAVSNQEVVYKEDTALSRLATDSPFLSDNDEILADTNYDLPGLQIQ